MAILASAAATAPPTLDAERVERDLIGHSMGGGEKCWNFQHPDQILELFIEDTREADGALVVGIACTLHDSRVPGTWEATADVVYRQTTSGWQITIVGLKTMRKSDD